MANQLCIHCKHCISDALVGEHYCYYPDWLSPIDNGPCVCRHARADERRCKNGIKWEAKPVKQGFWQKIVEWFDWNAI